jgi:Flp pilus assembly protein TadD
MRRVGWIAVLAFGVTACGVNRQEKIRFYAEDGLHLYQNGDYRHARMDFDAALALAPGDVTLEYDVAQCWDRLGRDDKAENLYRDVLGRAPNHAETRHALTVLLVRQGRRDEAVRLVQDWLARQPQLSSPYAEDAYLWHQYGDLQKALGRLQQGYALDPHDNRVLVEMAMLYEEMHYPDRAISLYEQALKYQPAQPDVEQRLSQLRSQGVGAPRPN